MCLDLGLRCALAKSAGEVERLVFLFACKPKNEWIVSVWEIELQSPEDSFTPTAL